MLHVNVRRAPLMVNFAEEIEGQIMKSLQKLLCGEDFVANFYRGRLVKRARKLNNRVECVTCRVIIVTALTKPRGSYCTARSIAIV